MVAPVLYRQVFLLFGIVVAVKTFGDVSYAPLYLLRLTQPNQNICGFACLGQIAEAVTAAGFSERSAALIAYWRPTFIGPNGFALCSAFHRFFRPLKGTPE